MNTGLGEPHDCAFAAKNVKLCGTGRHRPLRLAGDTRVILMDLTSIFDSIRLIK